MLDGASVLITGGTGSFGQRFIDTLLREHKPERLVVFSRDELKQFEMQQRWSMRDYPCLRYFIGDVRDRDRMIRALAGVDIVIHAAAMKHITAAEYNPTECIATNILGAQNLIDAAIANDVGRVVALSTDKAANPINLYGATKLCSDKLFVAANNLAGKHRTRFTVVRYGNVAGSRGSVIPFFKKLVADGASALPITDERMTRFTITLDQGVAFVLRALETLHGGEILVPKLPSLKIVDVAQYLLPDRQYDIIGPRPGEKIHEVLIPLEESRNCVDVGDHYVLLPSHHWWNVEESFRSVRAAGSPVEADFEYASDTNDSWLAGDNLASLIDEIDPA